MEKSFIINLIRSTILLVLYCSVAKSCQSATLLVSGITEDEKTIILQEHNRLRQLVANGRLPGQPGAENMREIHWDDELAARAQKWADNCQFRHDPQRAINRFTMGQNLAIIWSTAPLEADDGDFPSRIQNWFNEVQKYSFGDAWSPKTGHYSQLVWGETSLVGCGYSEYKDRSKYNKLYVCNYGPGGNVIGFNPYEVGQPSCGSYGMRPSARYQGLCAAPSLNSIASNTIETYEYTHSNSFNTNTNTKHTNTYTNTDTNTDTNTKNYYKPATTVYNNPSSSSSSSKQAISSSSGYTNTHRASSSSSYSYSAASQTNRRSSTASKEIGQYNHNTYKYKNKFETYKPSKTEYQTAIRKHTILRTYINTSSSSKLQTQTHTLYNSQPQLTEVSEVTVAPAKSGWSLLSWRG